MDTQITARHFKARESLKAHVEERVSQLEKYYNGITGAHVILEHGTPGVKSAEINLNVRRQHLVAKEESSTYETAVDNCVNQLKRQLLRHKDKLRSKERDHFK